MSQMWSRRGAEWEIWLICYERDGGAIIEEARNALWMASDSFHKSDPSPHPL